MRKLFAITFVAASFGLVGCGDDDAVNDINGQGGTYAVADAQVGNDAAAASDAGKKSDEPLFGSFAVNLIAAVPKTETTEAEDARASVFAQLRNGEVPEAIVWTEAATDGDCELLTPSIPFCESTCPGEVCVAEDECQAHPDKRTVGSIHVSGIADDELTIKPVAENYQLVGKTLAYPPCAEGDELTLRADGGSFAPFTMKTQCIAPFELPRRLATETGKPLALSWKAPGKSGLGRIQIKVNMSNHGTEKGKIECETADDGSFELSASIVQQLVDLGVAGFSYIEVKRVQSSSGSTPQLENLSFEMGQLLHIDLDVDGVVSCHSSDECPDGQTCSDILKCE